MHTITLKLRIPEQKDAENPKMNVSIISEFTDNSGNVQRGKVGAYEALILYDFFKDRFRNRLEKEYVERPPILRRK